MKIHHLILFIILISAGCQPKSELSHEEQMINRIAVLEEAGYDIIDHHAHLKGGLTMDQLLEHGKKTGITYGVAVNCGWGFPVQTDSALSAYYHSMKGYPAYTVMQAEGREWLEMFNTDTVALFDYVFTDALTWFDKEGRRTRLWIDDEVFIDDVEEFMDYYVDQIATIISNEPVDIFVNPTFLPNEIRDRYDELWTEERMLKVVNALVESGVALEINAKTRIPSPQFIKLAKKHGVKFTFGTNNGNADLGYLEYGLDMIEECDLKPGDFWKVDKN